MGFDAATVSGGDERSTRAGGLEARRIAVQDRLQGGERRSAVDMDTPASAVLVYEENRDRLPHVQLC